MYSSGKLDQAIGLVGEFQVLLNAPETLQSHKINFCFIHRNTVE
jgi:hypothetical protein